MKVNSKVSSGYKVNIGNDCEKEASNFSQVLQCLMEHDSIKIDLLVLQISNELKKADHLDPIEWLESSHEHWTRDSEEFCNVIGRKAWETLGVWSNEVWYSCHKKKRDHRVAELEQLLLAVSKNDFDHYLNQ